MSHSALRLSHCAHCSAHGSCLFHHLTHTSLTTATAPQHTVCSNFSTQTNPHMLACSLHGNSSALSLPPEHHTLLASGSSEGIRWGAARLPRGLLKPSMLLLASKVVECQAPNGAHQYLEQSSASYGLEG